MSPLKLLRVLFSTGRVVSPVVAGAAVVTLGVMAWRSWLRLREEQRWEDAWADFQRRPPRG